MNPDCTYPGCDQPTQNYLCNTCVDDLQADQDRVPDLIPTLQLITRGEEKPLTQKSARGGGGGKGGPGEPINLSALSLIQNFQLMQPAQEYARHRDGWKSKQMIHAWVRNADLMANGEKETKNTPEFQKLQVKANGLEVPMRPGEIVRYLQESEARITDLTEGTIRQWKSRGKIAEYTIKEIFLAYEKRAKSVV